MFDWWGILALLYSLWERVDNVLLVIAIVGGGLYLNRVLGSLRQERLDLEEAVETLSWHVQAIKDAADQGSDEHWEQIRGMWAAIRERIEYAIENIEDGRRRRKYSRLPRYSYQKVIEHLQRDFELSRDVTDALQQMNAWFLGLRRSKSATKEQVHGIWGYYQLADKGLPRIPGEVD